MANYLTARLPTELRLKIYRRLWIQPEVLVLDGTLQFSGSYGPGGQLLRTCRIIYNEGLKVLYTQSRITYKCRKSAGKGPVEMPPLDPYKGWIQYIKIEKSTHDSPIALNLTSLSSWTSMTYLIIDEFHGNVLDQEITVPEQLLTDGGPRDDFLVNLMRTAVNTATIEGPVDAVALRTLCHASEAERKFGLLLWFKFWFRDPTLNMYMVDLLFDWDTAEISQRMVKSLGIV